MKCATLSDCSAASSRLNFMRTCGILFALVLIVQLLQAQPMEPGSAWNKGVYAIDRKGVVERSDIVLQRPNSLPGEAMPLGNGRLGVAVWAQEGFTAQLNRGDTFPLRLSPGQVVLPGLEKLTQASDYQGRLNLYNGEFEESGGGMTATVYLDESLDVLVVDVKGADPKTEQTAELRLWDPRKPQVIANGAIGTLAETWLDDKEAGASNETFGSLAAVTTDGLKVHAESMGPLAVRVSFLPRSDGTFRVLVGSPSWRGGDAGAAATKLLTSAKSIGIDEHREWWNKFWGHAGLMKLSSPDHVAEYFENLRMIDLFTAAAESRDRLPVGPGGIGNLFSSIRDEQRWGPSAYWHWNLRMQVSANLGAGVSELNAPYFRLYRENLDNILHWTKQHMGGRPGLCIPETMRFNGQGYENETWIPAPAINCGEDFQPYYNARTISTGAEVALWVWEQYEYTGNLKFLARNYPLMSGSARFLLAYATHDANGTLHTFPSNSHETQWDVHDPTTDIAAMHALFPRVVLAATLLKTDADLVSELQKEIGKLASLPMAAISSPNLLVQPGTDREDTMIAPSYDPGAPMHNTENDGLEPVWPYGMIGDDGPLHAIGVRTYLNRPNKNEDDWSFDPVQAARLGLADEVKSSLLALTQRYQTSPSGFASFMGPGFFVEQVGVLADALQKSLADDYDGLIRIAPAWPKDWDADGTVYLRHGNKAEVRIRGGQVIEVGLEIAKPGAVRMRNPWQGRSVEIVNARDSSVVVPTSSDAVLAFTAHAAMNYLMRPAGQAGEQVHFEAIAGMPATAPKSLGKSSIGLAR